MKNIKRVILVLVCTLLLSGCVKIHTNMTINSDKSMIYENEILISTKLGDMGSATTDEEAQAEYKQRGFNVELVEEKDGYGGAKLSKKFDNIDKLSESNGSVVDIANFYDKDFDTTKVFKLDKGFFKNTYTANFKYKAEFNSGNEMNLDSDEDDFSDFPNLDEEVGATEKPLEMVNETVADVETNGTDLSSNETFGDFAELTKLMGESEFTYVVNLPVAANSNNATEVTNDGKTLKWNLAGDAENSIQFSFSLLNMTNIMIVCGGCIILIIVVSVVLILKSRKKDKQPVDNFTPTVVNDNNVGEAPIGEIAGSEEVNNSIETINNETASVQQTVETPVEQPVAMSVVQPEIAQQIQPEVVQPAQPEMVQPMTTPEEPVLENPVENMINSVEPVYNTEPILNIEIPTIPEVPTATMEEISTVPMDIEEGVIPLTVEHVETPENPEFVLPTVNGEAPVVEENKEVVNPEFVMPTVTDTGIPEVPINNNINNFQ